MKYLTLVCLIIVSGVFNFARADTSKVDDVLNAFHTAASQADGTRYFALLDDKGVFIGTDASERWTKQAFEQYAMPYFNAGKGWTYVPTERQVTVSEGGEVAWFHELLENQKYGQCRGTGVLVKTPAGWRIAQYHLTIPIPNDLSLSLVEMIREADAQATH